MLLTITIHINISPQLAKRAYLHIYIDM